MTALPTKILEEKRMKILVYRRTHTGDPNSKGVFGCNNDMGSIRDWNYAVIGIGGKNPHPSCGSIKERITWVGICPVKTVSPHGFKGSLVTFRKFILWDGGGPLVKGNYPALYEYMFEKNRIPRTALFNIAVPNPCASISGAADTYTAISDDAISSAPLNFPKDIYKELLAILSMAEKEIGNRINATNATQNHTACSTSCKNKSKGDS
jgi:hypothetical protein